MTKNQSVVCYLKDNNEVATWNALLKPYASLANVITFVPFNGTDKYNIVVDTANAIAKNNTLDHIVNFVAIFNSNVNGISDLSILKDIMINSNVDKKENIYAFTLKTLWYGDVLPSLDQIDNHNLHFDNKNIEHEEFVEDYENNICNFARANKVFQNFINLLFEKQMISEQILDEVKSTEICTYVEPEEKIVEEPVVEEPVQEIVEKDEEVAIEEPVIEEVQLPASETILEDEIEFEDEIDLSTADKIIIVPKKCREFYKNVENDFNGIIRIQKITNLKSVSAIIKQQLIKNKNTAFYFFPATSVKNQKVYEQKYLALFNYVYKKFNKNPHVQFFKTSGKHPSLYLENILNFDRNTKDVLNKKYTDNKNYNDLINWLKQK